MSRNRRRKAAPTRRLTPLSPLPERDRGAGAHLSSSQGQGAPLVVPHDPALLEAAQQLWHHGDWQSLAKLGGDDLQHHPQRGTVAAYRAVAAVQMGERRIAEALGRQALEWGCSRDEMARLMLAASRLTLARASHVAGRARQSAAHLERAFPGARLSSEIRRLGQARVDDLEQRLRTARQAQSLLRRGGQVPPPPPMPQWLVRLATHCAQADDPHAHIDDALADNVRQADDRVRFMLVLADLYIGQADRMTALHFLTQAVREATGVALPDELRQALIQRLVALNAPAEAMQLAVSTVLKDLELTTDAVAVTAMRSAFTGMKERAGLAQEHGHDLLLQHLKVNWRSLVDKAGGRRLNLIEIGTTREEVPGQGSTRKIAEFCRSHGLHFITVDMDPHNSRMAQEMFEAMGVSFEAVTMKGEDYLRERMAPIDLVFLDAYDYDHGQHSSLRQSRYEKYLGARIDEQACHQMHLDCAQSVAAKLWEHGLVCVDDTWRAGDGWTAKGTLAVPYLLDRGFELLDERNKAVLLRPGSGSAPA